MAQLPDDETGKTLEQFQQSGFNLSMPMEVDFFVAVPSREQGDQVTIKIRKLGFTTSVEQDKDTCDWTCYCTKSMIPEYAEVLRIERELNDIAKPFGGYADGFGSYGNA